MPGPFDGQVSGTTRFPVIDTDPHAVRVVRYFRTRDYGTWATVTAGFPAAYYLWGRFDPMPSAARASLRKTYTLAAVLGAFGGFLMAYQNSSKRLWGWSENQREQDMDRAEMTQKIAEGKPLYGTTSQPEHMQRVAVQNSRHSQLFYAVFPWFNLVNHPYHGDFADRYKKEGSTEPPKE